MKHASKTSKQSATAIDCSPTSTTGQRTRTLWTAGTAHALHDGYTDAIYLLLPIWQAEFALSYSMLAMLRGIAATTMATLQVPVGRFAERIGGRTVLVAGTALAAFGYLLAGLSTGLLGLCAALFVLGCGLSTQHPVASAAVSRAYGAGARGLLGVYNFAGDVGKAALPAMLSVLLVIMIWQHAMWVAAALGAGVAVAIALLLPKVPSAETHAQEAKVRQGQDRGGFNLLLAIGMLDSSVRMGFLTFLPFLLKAQGASLSTVGLALGLVFAGGAAGKFACGWLGARFGVLPTVIATELGTTLAILAVLALPLVPALVVLPLLGIMINGTSSVLYGTVPELVPQQAIERAFAFFYTGTIGAGALAPILYGALGDATGVPTATIATALTAIVTLPLVIILAPKLSTPG
jgi:FSR family fosmidomycin resistance protein-like MFS transporter